MSFTWSRSTHLSNSRSLWMTDTSGSHSNFCLAVTEYGVAYDHFCGRGVHGTIIVRILGICGVMGVISSMGGLKRTIPTELPIVLCVLCCVLFFCIHYYIGRGVLLLVIMGICASLSMMVLLMGTTLVPISHSELPVMIRV